MVVHQTGEMSLVVFHRDQCWVQFFFFFFFPVSDIDDGLSSKISKFAHDTKIAIKVAMTGDKKKLQNELDRLVSWTQK